MFSTVLCVDYCDHINSPNPKTGLMTNCCDFNVGFGLDFWNDWCNLLKRPLPMPLQDAIDLVKPDKNMVVQHPKLTYDTTDMWFYLKADSEEDCKTMTKVSPLSALWHQQNLVHRGNE